MTRSRTKERADAFKMEVEAWARRLRVRPHVVRVQSMRRKWASCSPRGYVCFARDLLDEEPAFRSYVVVHELLHLRYRNHGKLFRAALHSYLTWAGIPEHEGTQVQCAARVA